VPHDGIPRPRVLLGNLEPVVRLGMVRVLEEGGCEVLEDGANDVVDQAGRLRPDAVVLDLDHGFSQELGRLVRSAAPSTKVVFWARDEDVMEVLDPGATSPRLVVDAAREGLCSELSARPEKRVEE
jgi:DNA-binding NarL/FixJ family response regulator